jgi:hypothetical protein
MRAVDQGPGLTIQCHEVVELVTEYLECALDGPTRAEFQARLALSTGCDEHLI